MRVEMPTIEHIDGNSAHLLRLPVDIFGFRWNPFMVTYSVVRCKTDPLGMFWLRYEN